VTDPRSCVEARAAAAELALGTLEGDERGAVLAHLAGCSACRTEARELAAAADALLVLAPGAEPPAGFESAVLDRIVAERRAVVPLPRRRGRIAALVAAAVVLVAGGVATGLAVEGPGGASSTLEQAAMVTPDGRRVGEVWRYGEDDAAVLFVSVPAWAEVDPADAPGYALRLDLAGGDSVDVAEFSLDGEQTSWGASTELPGDDIEAVSVVDDTGRVWCTGTFT